MYHVSFVDVDEGGRERASPLSYFIKDIGIQAALVQYNQTPASKTGLATFPEVLQFVGRSCFNQMYLFLRRIVRVCVYVCECIFRVVYCMYEIPKTSDPKRQSINYILMFMVSSSGFRLRRTAKRECSVYSFLARYKI